MQLALHVLPRCCMQAMWSPGSVCTVAILNMYCWLTQMSSASFPAMGEICYLADSVIILWSSTKCCRACFYKKRSYKAALSLLEFSFFFRGAVHVNFIFKLSRPSVYLHAYMWVHLIYTIWCRDVFNTFLLAQLLLCGISKMYLSSTEILFQDMSQLPNINLGASCQTEGCMAQHPTSAMGW